jgi:hypothetical protein
LSSAKIIFSSFVFYFLLSLFCFPFFVYFYHPSSFFPCFRSLCFLFLYIIFVFLNISLRIMGFQLVDRNVRLLGVYNCFICKLILLQKYLFRIESGISDVAI